MDSPGAPKDTAQSNINMSTPTSPTDNRHPLARVESISEQFDRAEEAQGLGLSESYQSTDTVRRRTEPQSYGMLIWQNPGVEYSIIHVLGTDHFHRHNHPANNGTNTRAQARRSLPVRRETTTPGYRIFAITPTY